MRNFMVNVKKKIDRCSVSAYIRAKKLKDDIRGMGTIEVVLITAVLVALAILFKTFMSKYADGIFGKIEDKTDEAFKDW